MRLSIIVPVYNVEQYIVKCIDSLLLNNTNDYEIIVVNDGTKDRSIELVKNKFCDSKIRIVEQENQGLSAARNTGVAEAMGDYIWFVDSDDWVEPNSVDTIIDALCGEHVDILYQMTTLVYKNGVVSVDKRKGYKGMSNGVQLLQGACPTCAPFYIVERGFWLAHRFAFYRGILHEDNELMFKVIYKAQKIKCLERPLYYHNLREGSITQIFNPKRCYSLSVVCKSLYDFMQSEVSQDEYYIFAPYIIDAFYAMLDAAKEGDSKTKRDINSFLIKNPCVTSLLWKFGDRKAQLFFLACKLSLGHFVQTCALFRKIHP